MCSLGFSYRNPWTRFFCAIAVLMGAVRIDALAQTFQEFVVAVGATPVYQRTSLVDSFLAAVPRVPLVEADTLCTFFWRGSASSVAIAGDHNGWNPAAGGMTRLSTTNLWYRTQVFPADARIDYKFVIDGKMWVPDSLNPHTIAGGFGLNSEVRMPSWVFPQEVMFNASVPHGTVYDTTITSVVLGNTRKIQLYVPPGIRGPSESFALLIVHDGLEYVTLAQMPNVLDNLIAAKAIKPVVVVFVPPVNRNSEYSGDRIGHFASFIVTELLPFVKRQYRISSRASDCASLGASAGGNVALWLSMTHPEVFGGAAAQSSSVIDSIAHGFQNGPSRNLRIYLDIGTYDIAILLPMVRNFRSILDRRGYAYTYREIHEGHSWGSWRSHLDDILKFLFPFPAAGR